MREFKKDNVKPEDMKALLENSEIKEADVEVNLLRKRRRKLILKRI